MKNRVISTLLAAVMLLSVCARLAGCSPGSSMDMWGCNPAVTFFFLLAALIVDSTRFMFCSVPIL